MCLRVSQGVTTFVSLANGFKFKGSECRDEAEAVQSASSVALFQLVNSIKSDLTGGDFLQ